MTKPDSSTDLKALSRTDLVAIKKGSKRLSFRERFTAYPLQKLIALILSLVFFFIVLSDRNTSQVYSDIPINLQIPEQFVIEGAAKIYTADVMIQARASVLKRLNRNELGVINLEPPAREGKIQINLTPDMMIVPKGVKVMAFSPEYLTINLEGLAERPVQVSTNNAVINEPLPGYQLEEIKVEPAFVEISGPKSVIESIHQLYIEPIDLSGRASNFRVQRSVIPIRPNVVSIENPNVTVSVNIISKSTERTILGVPIVSLNLTQPHEFLPPKADLVLNGEEEALAKVEPSTLFIVVDGSEDEKLPAHARIIKITNANIPNLPPGVGVNADKLQSIILKTSPLPPEENAQPMLKEDEAAEL
ncbi:MAG: YbbR-like domain-containing protein [Bradymonadales bacterium]|jgi:YbbR domain-containing protein